MDFQAFQLHAKKQNKRKNTLRNKKKCRDVSYSCNVLPNSAKIPKTATLINKFLRLNQKVLTLTKELWNDLLNIVNQVKVLSRKNSCFSINDVDECKALNAFYFQFNSNFIRLKDLYNDTENGDDDLEVLTSIFTLLESFFEQTLPIFEKDIKKLQITIAICRKKGCGERSFFKDNAGNEVNTAIKNYLKKLKLVFTRNEYEENILPEIKTRKEKIVFEIDRIYSIKRNLYVNNLFEDTNTANISDNLLENTGFENRSNFVIAEDINKTAELPFDFDVKPNSMPKNISETTISPQTKEYIMHDINYNNTSRYDAFTSFKPEDLNEKKLSAEENLINFASIVSVIGLLTFLVYFCFKKYNERKKEILGNDEQERFKELILNK